MADYTFDSNVFTPAGTSVSVGMATPVETTVTVNPTASTVTVNPTASTVTVNPTASTVTLNPTVSTVTLTPMASTVTLNPASSTLTLNPVTSNVNLGPISSAMKLDVEPMVTDVCTRVTFGPLPRTSVRQPHSYRVGYSLLGVEIFGISLEGESRTIVESLPEAPRIVFGREATGAAFRVRADD